MKRNAITRIILYSIVILLLIGLLISGLGMGSFMFQFSGLNGPHSLGNGSASAEDIQSIQIQWASGSVTIRDAETDTITFSESGKGSDEEPMAYQISDGKLTICYQEPGFRFGFFSAAEKDLVITVPESWSCSRLQIESASTTVKISDQSVSIVEIDAASGRYSFDNCTVSDLSADTASADIHFSGSLTALDCDAASADFTGVFTNVPEELCMDAASGDLNITLPEDCGFRVEMDAVSGKFRSDFETSKKGDAYIYGDSSCLIEFDGASGSVTIHKG